MNVKRIPAGARAGLVEALAAEFGDTVVVEEVACDRWTAADAPVVLRNPRIFRPFELLISLLPLPRYGSIDPTPAGGACCEPGERRKGHDTTGSARP